MRFWTRERTAPKVFCVGWHKTGTTSMGIALKTLGYKVGGWPVSKEKELIRHWHEGRMKAIIAVAKRYDAQEDFPWPIVFRELDQAFPEAKFVLTHRKDEITWLRSVQAQGLRRGNQLSNFLVYGSYDAIKDAEIYRRRYADHNAAVTEYFRDRPGKLLPICLENGEGWPALCAFLGKPVPRKPFPHANRTADKAV